MVHVLVINTDKNIISVASSKYKGTPEEIFLKIADDLEEMADAENLTFNKTAKKLIINTGK